MSSIHNGVYAYSVITYTLFTMAVLSLKRGTELNKYLLSSCG